MYYENIFNYLFDIMNVSTLLYKFGQIRDVLILKKAKTNYNYNLERNGGVNSLIPVNAELRVSDSAAVCLSVWDDPTPCSLHRRNHAGELSRFEIRSISRFMRRRREEIRDSALAPTTSGYQAGRLMRMPGQTELVPVHGTSCKCRGCQDRRSAAPGNELISLS
uniref:Uncharacterized protein n=1 Tax=Setaria viridis TaxID=4556 RepID=A0A4U6VBS9_SETVI|nr:hypothetical protein SEVIR_3G058800v2 [Setaria viridis]